MLMKSPIDGIQAEIIQGIVHPSHIPFKRKSQPSDIRRSGDPWPCGGFFRNHHNAGMFLMSHGVQLFQKFHRFQIFSAPEFIGNPFTGFSRIIEIQHRRDSIHSKTIDVVPVEPTECAIDQKVFDFSPAVIKDPAIPFWMKSKPRVGMVI
jgi:hypothetical protein